MSSRASFDVIKAAILAGWAATPVYFENEDWTATNTPTHFLMVEIFGSTFEQASIGVEPRKDNRWREDGQIYGHIMTERGAGSAQARTYADAFCEIFRGQEITGVVFRDMSIGSSEPGDKDGKYWRMTATIDWQRDSDV